jgi:hypothetical protein
MTWIFLIGSLLAQVGVRVAHVIRCHAGAEGWDESVGDIAS